MNPLTWLKGKAWLLWLAVVAMLVPGIALQQLRIAEGEVELADVRRDRAEENSMRARIALIESDRLARAERTHATQQQEMVDGFTQTIQALQLGRAADADHAERLSNQLAHYAARDREAARSDPAACERIADRSEVLAGVAGEGAALLVEGRRIVEQRDAEVALLLGIVGNDRVLLQAPEAAAMER